jgi:hypothetical protein
MALKPVQERDVFCGEASYKRAADAVLLRGELPSEERLAPLSGNDSRVIRKLHEMTRFMGCKKILVGTGERPTTRDATRCARQCRVVKTRRTLTLCRV